MKIHLRLPLFLLLAAVPAAAPLSGCRSWPAGGAVRAQAAVAGDPYQARIYRLPNGLTVCLSVDREKPRIQTLIGVRAGGMYDPLDKTGQAHYLEHLMFKGTDRLGTTDWAAERPLLEQIDALYDRYCQTADAAGRDAIYRKIDRLASQAVKSAAPGELDRLYSALGAKSINAYTSQDRTVYIGEIPANQLKNWLTLESERFSRPVFRVFHTELETVYEELNMGQDNPENRFWMAYEKALFGKHPYGREVIGLAEHLRNPAPRRVMDFFRAWYVPGNMAVCLAGDFDPDEALKLVADAFGGMPAAPVPAAVFPAEPPLRGEKRLEFVSPALECGLATWRLDNPDLRTSDLLFLCSKIMSNGKAGLLDRDLKQPQKVMEAASSIDDSPWFAILELAATPLPGQPPESMIPLLDAEMNKLKKGEFADWLLEAIVNNLELEQGAGLRSTEERASALMDSFIRKAPWAETAGRIQRLRAITKREIVAFAQAQFGPDRLVTLRRQGPLASAEKLAKPTITPLAAERNAVSAFAKAFNTTPARELQPQYPDLGREIQRLPLPGGRNDIPLLATGNRLDNTFTLQLVFPVGSDHDLRLPLAAEYAALAGTTRRTLAEFQDELYRLGGEIQLASAARETRLTVHGLQRNFARLLELAEETLDCPAELPAVLPPLTAAILESRKVARETPAELFRGLVAYAKNGPVSPVTRQMTPAALAAVTTGELAGLVRGLKRFPHKILYYGPAAPAAAAREIAAVHTAPTQAERPPRPLEYEEPPTAVNRVLCVDLPVMKQVEVALVSRCGIFNPDDAAVRRLFNESFGGNSMASLTFQALRETKALCYGCSSRLATPDTPGGHHYFITRLGTQAEKLPEAVAALRQLIDGFPLGAALLESARASILKQGAAERFEGLGLFELLDEQERYRLPLDYRRRIHEQVRTLGLRDLEQFHRGEIKPNRYTMVVLGDLKRLDMGALRTFGPVTVLQPGDVMPEWQQKTAEAPGR